MDSPDVGLEMLDAAAELPWVVRAGLGVLRRPSRRECMHSRVFGRW